MQNSHLFLIWVLAVFNQPSLFNATQSHFSHISMSLTPGFTAMRQPRFLPALAFAFSTAFVVWPKPLEQGESWRALRTANRDSRLPRRALGDSEDPSGFSEFSSIWNDFHFLVLLVPRHGSSVIAAFCLWDGKSMTCFDCKLFVPGAIQPAIMDARAGRAVK